METSEGLNDSVSALVRQPVCAAQTDFCPVSALLNMRPRFFILILLITSLSTYSPHELKMNCLGCDHGAKAPNK
jgi:hypothetical protein